MHSFPGLSHHVQPSAPRRGKPSLQQGLVFRHIKADSSDQAASGACPSETSLYYLPFLFLLCLYDMQTLHEARDALLQAVNGVMLRVMATEAVAQAAESISDELEVTGLWLKGKCWWHATMPYFHPHPSHQAEED